MKTITSIPRMYLAGPMTGIVEQNFPLFHAEATRLRALNFDVVNPAEMNGGPDELVAVTLMTEEQKVDHWRRCMRRDIAQLLTCDAIAMLPGWEQSRGACLENLIACDLGLPVYMAAEIDSSEIDLALTAGCGIAVRLRHWATIGDELSIATATRAPIDDLRTVVIASDLASKRLLKAVSAGGAQ